MFLSWCPAGLLAHACLHPPGEIAKADLEAQKEHFELLLHKAKSDQVRTQLAGLGWRSTTKSF